MTRWLTIAGIGEDGWDGLSPAARAAITDAALVIGGARHLSLIPECAGQERMAWPSPLSDAFPGLLARRGQDVCVLASGDPSWYGIGATLSRLVPAAEMRVFPAPSSFSLAAARLGWPLQEVGCLTVHGRPLELVIPHLHPGARLLVLSWDGTTPGTLAALLSARGFGPSRLTVLEAMGGVRERITSFPAAEAPADPFADLNTVAVEVVGEPGARVIPLAPGLPDDWFDHDGQITKREIRALTLSFLAPRRGGLLWDVGAGSGSVGIEWMLCDPSCRTIAVEGRGDRSGRIPANAAALGVPGLELVVGTAPDALAGLPRPDAVFIGGGLTNAGVVDACWAALKPGGRLAANGVTLETEAALTDWKKRLGGDLVRLSVARAQPLGGFLGWKPLMPITLWTVEKPWDVP